MYSVHTEGEMEADVWWKKKVAIIHDDVGDEHVDSLGNGKHALVEINLTHCREILWRFRLHQKRRNQ